MVLVDYAVIGYFITLGVFVKASVIFYAEFGTFNEAISTFLDRSFI